MLGPEDPTITVSADWLAGAVETRERAGDFKEAALYAFALAKLAYKDKDESVARYYGYKCLELLKKYPTDTLEQCASPNVSIAGVLIPGLFHEGTVREQLGFVS